MDWTRHIDGYCERLGPGLFAEPANALTNLAFVVVTVWLWRRTAGIERSLAAVLLAIGVGSGLFHTVATPWAALADVVPIGVFVLLYVYAANRRFLFLSRVPAALGALLVLPYAALAGALFARVPGFDVSAPYWPIPVLIAGYAMVLRVRSRQVAEGLALGAAILAVSLAFRSVDGAVCGLFPVGTHFAWHLLNATMLGWMITVLRRHRLDPPRRGG